MRGPRMWARPLRAVATLLTVIALAVGVTLSVNAAVGDDAPRVAFLARSDNPVDALSASAVAAQLNGIVVLTPSWGLHASARQALIDFAPDLVVLAGGEAALSPQVLADVEAIPLTARRVEGAGRHETSAAIAALKAELGGSHLDATDADALREPRAQTIIGGGATPALDADRTIGFTAVDTPAVGIYCLAVAPSAGVDVSTAIVHVGIEWVGSIGAGFTAAWNAGNTECLATEIEVRAYDNGTLTDNAAITVLIP